MSAYGDYLEALQNSEFQYRSEHAILMEQFTRKRVNAIEALLAAADEDATMEFGSVGHIVSEMRRTRPVLALFHMLYDDGASANLEQIEAAATQVMTDCPEMLQDTLTQGLLQRAREFLTAGRNRTPDGFPG